LIAITWTVSANIHSISDLESRLGAGLIEEVIQVAEGEHKLVDTMVQAKVWEPLEEQAPEGQWSYFERMTHTSTQKP
jgi:NADH dehydrogenase (ubiquinone) 1 alpha subcomplex subunit 5